MNERRGGRSARAADFRRLALWFAEASSDADAHRLWRAAFALSPARHLALAAESGAGASVSWRDAPPVVCIRYCASARDTCEGSPTEESRPLAGARAPRGANGTGGPQTERARRRLATGRAMRLSELGILDRHAFALFLTLLGEALAAQMDEATPVDRLTMDGTLRVRLEPLEADSYAEIETELGRFAVRDHPLDDCAGNHMDFGPKRLRDRLDDRADETARGRSRSPT